MTLFWVVGGLVLAFGFVVFFGAPYVPSRRRYVQAAFEKLYPLSEKDVLLDLGSGDGVVLRQATRHGARAVGFELNPLLVAVAWWASRRTPRATTRLANLWTTPFPVDTTVVYLFGDQRDIGKMKRRVQAEATRLGRTLMVISYGFELPGLSAQKTEGAYYLYAVKSLQARKPQV